MLNDNSGLSEYQVEYVRKAVKRVTIRVTDGEFVRVTFPLEMPEQYAREFLCKKRDWVEKQLERLRRKENFAVSGYHEQQQLRILDNLYILRIVNGEPLVIINDSEIIVYCHEKNQIADLLDDCLASVAQRLLRETFEDVWLKTGAKFSRIKPSLVIKTAVSKWGSYSKRTHKIMLNEKLVRYPGSALELIIIHELCHIKELNHRQGFYELLGQILPDWRVRKKLLRQDYPKFL